MDVTWRNWIFSPSKDLPIVLTSYSLQKGLKQNGPFAKSLLL